MNVNGFINSLSDYAHHLPWVQTLLLPILGLGLCYVGGILLNRSFVRPNADDELTHDFYQHRAQVWAGFWVMVLTLWLIVYCWARGIYQAESGFLRHAELGSLLLLVVCGVYSAYWLWQLRGYYTRQRIWNVVEQANTNVQGRARMVKARTAFDKTKLGVLVLVLGALGLVSLVWSPRTLVSIVIDDSGSMGPALEVGSDALAEVMPLLNKERTHVMLTSFGKSDPDSTRPFSSFATLTRVTKADSLDAKTTFLEDPLAVSAFVLGLKPPKKLFGLNAAIWQNYLRSRAQSENVHYNNRVLLIVSDGEEFSRGWYNTTFCQPETDFGDFYANQVYFIDLLPASVTPLPTTQGFRTVMKECFGEDHIRNGNVREDYLSALTDVFNPYRFDVYLPFWVLGLCVVYILLIFLINVSSEFSKLLAANERI